MSFYFSEYTTTLKNTFKIYDINQFYSSAPDETFYCSDLVICPDVLLLTNDDKNNLKSIGLHSREKIVFIDHQNSKVKSIDPLKRCDYESF